MTTTTQPNMEGIESRRLQLEEAASKLRKALDHWATWEMEYQILKEELQAAGSPLPAQMVEIGRNMQGKLVNEEEVDELLGKNLPTKRTANQVIDMISRRLDYVQQNREKIEEQFEKAQKQLEAFEMLTDNGLENEEGLPMMDIEEQLDDDDNVVSSNVSQPGKVAPELVEALRKAGVHQEELRNTEEDLNVNRASPVKNPAAPPTFKSSSKDEASIPPKKSVSFANDVQIETFEKPKTLQDDAHNWNLKPGAKVYELDEEGEEILSTAVVPSDTPEEAELRKEMLRYGLDEVNDVVAELELEDDYGDEDTEDEYDYNEEPDSDLSEEEDKFGRSTRRVLSDDYVKEMQDLEKKLNARMMENVGPSSGLVEKAGDARTLRVREDDAFDRSITTEISTPTQDATPGMASRVSDDFHASEASQPTNKASIPVKLPPTVSDTIVERVVPNTKPLAAPSKPTKVSRFKSTRAASSGPPIMLPNPIVPEPPPVPTGPSGRVLATSVAEHVPHPSEPHAPDEFDPIIHNRQVTAEYHKLRNKMISQQGGFQPSEQDEIDPIVEERDGKAKKVSRFKAAKLKAEGL